MSDPEHVLVVFGEVKRAAHDLLAAADQLRTGLQGVDTSVDNVAGRSWSGGAAKEYGDIWDRWSEGFESVVTGLTDLSQWMDTAAEAYRRQTGG